MKYIFIIFFLLGAITYFVFPRDWTTSASKDAVMPYKIVQVVDEANVQCTIVADPSMEGRCAKIR